MELHICAIGRLPASHQSICDSLLRQLRGVAKQRNLHPITITQLRHSPQKSASQTRTDETNALQKTLPAKAHIVALDSAGQELSSQNFAKALAAWSETGKPALCFVIGGANGLTPAFCQKADTHLSLGQATWSHELARIMLLEQLWRGVALLANHPYASK